MMPAFIHQASVQFRTALTAILVLLMLAGCGTAGSNEVPTTVQGGGQEKVVIHIGVQGKTGIFPYARDKRYFEQAFEKVGVEVQWTEFQSGPPHFEALASNRLDFGAVGGTPVVSGQVGGVDFKAVAVTSDGKKGNFIVVPKDSPIRRLEDLRGAKIGVAKGSSAYNFLFMALARGGLKGDDIKLIQLQPDEARPALDSGAIDAWSIWEPYATTAVFQSGAKILVSGQDLNINAPGFLVARTSFLEKHPDLAVLFLKTYEEARRYFVDHLDEVAADISRTQKLDLEITKTVLSNADPILSPVTPEFAKAHQEQADFLFNEGAIGKKLDTSEVFENKYVEQALKELQESGG